MAVLRIIDAGAVATPWRRLRRDRGLRAVHPSRLATLRTIMTGPLPTDVQAQECTVAVLFRSSVALNYLTGGARDGTGYFVEPTVFAGVSPDMTIAREEIFGPVLGVLPVDGMDEALRIARDTEYGLHATVFTRDIDRALHLARRLPCGTVSVNGFSEGDIKTPFGGYKQSGSLSRDNGTEAMDQYLQTKTIWIARSGGA